MATTPARAFSRVASLGRTCMARCSPRTPRWPTGCSAKPSPIATAAHLRRCLPWTTAQKWSLIAKRRPSPSRRGDGGRCVGVDRSMITAKTSAISAWILGRRFWWWLGALFVICRLAVWLFPVDSDHWIFYYVGHRWFSGAQLYVGAWDHKAPLIYAFNGVLGALFGNNLAWHRVLLTL